MRDEAKSALKFATDELRKAATWKEEFGARQQDKARFFITLLSTEMFVVGLSLNTKPDQTYLLAPCAVSFLICFASAFWSMYHFSRSIAPRQFFARDGGESVHHEEGEEALLQGAYNQSEAQNQSLEKIIAVQAIYLQRGVRSFAIFNAVFAGALVVSRLTWFFPRQG